MMIELINSDTLEPMLVNMTNVLTLAKRERGNNVIIHYVGGNTVEVEESYDKVVELLHAVGRRNSNFPIISARD